MTDDITRARAAAVRTFLCVRRLARHARTLERDAGGDIPALSELALTLDALAYQAEAAVRGHAACLVAADLATADPALHDVAISMAGSAERWALILGTIARASTHLHARAVLATQPSGDGRRVIPFRTRDSQQPTGWVQGETARPPRTPPHRVAG